MPKTVYVRGSLESLHAVQFQGNFDEIEEFVGGDAEWRGTHVVVASKQGALRVKADEWLVRDREGHFRVLPPHLFADTFTFYREDSHA